MKVLSWPYLCCDFPLRSLLIKSPQKWVQEPEMGSWHHRVQPSFAPRYCIIRKHYIHSLARLWSALIYISTTKSMEILILLEFCKAFNILEISWKSRKYVLCEKALCHPLAKDSQNMLLNSLAWQFQNNPTFLKGRHLGTILNVIFQFFWTNRFVCWHPMIPKTGEHFSYVLVETAVQRLHV